MWQVKEKCLKMLSEYRERRCRCHVWWKIVLDVGAGNCKSPFVDGGEVERRYSKLVRGNRPDSLPGWHVSDTGEVWRSKLGRSLAVAWSGLFYGSWLYIHTFEAFCTIANSFAHCWGCESPTVVDCTPVGQGSARPLLISWCSSSLYQHHCAVLR